MRSSIVDTEARTVAHARARSGGERRRSVRAELELGHDRRVVARAAGAVETRDRAPRAALVAKAASRDPIEPQPRPPLGPREAARGEHAKRLRQRVHLAQPLEAEPQRGRAIGVALPMEARARE